MLYDNITDYRSQIADRRSQGFCTVRSVPSHVALLRGINIGPNKRVPMPALRDLVASLGYRDVSTYIASGNVLFSTRKKDAGKIAAELEKGIEDELGVSCRVLVLSRDELAKAV